jgi:hypothetical protein
LDISVPVSVPKQLVPNILLKNNFIDSSTGVGTGSGGSIVGGVPSYLVFGGLVFVILSQEYIDAEFDVEHMRDPVTWAEEFRILALADTNPSGNSFFSMIDFPIFQYDFMIEEDEEVVLLSQVIAHSCNIGYERNVNMRLVKVNQQPVRNLKHLKSILFDEVNNLNNSSYLVLEFKTGQIMVLNREAAINAEKQVRLFIVDILISYDSIYSFKIFDSLC